MRRASPAHGVAICGSILLSGWGVCVRAQGTGEPSDAGAEQESQISSGSTEEREAQGRAAFVRGRQKLESGDGAGALVDFRSAHELSGNALVYRSMAEAHRVMGDPEAELRALELYLQGRPEAPDRPEVQARLDKLRSARVPLTIKVEPKAARVTVLLNGETVSLSSPLAVMPGIHEVKVQAPGYIAQTHQVTAPRGESADVHVLLKPVPPKPVFEDPQGSTVHYTQRSGGSIPTAVWVAGAVTGVALLAGTTLGLAALSAQNDFDEDPTDDTADSGETLALLADLSFGVAAAGAITTVVLYFTERPGKSPDDRLGKKSIARSSRMVLPRVGPQGVGVDARFSF